MTESAAELTAEERRAMYATYRKADSDGLAAVYLLGVQAALADPARARELLGWTFTGFEPMEAPKIHWQPGQPVPEVTGHTVSTPSHRVFTSGIDGVVHAVPRTNALLAFGTPRTLEQRVGLSRDEGEEGNATAHR